MECYIDEQFLHHTVAETDDEPFNNDDEASDDELGADIDGDLDGGGNDLEDDSSPDLGAVDSDDE